MLKKSFKASFVFKKTKAIQNYFSFILRDEALVVKRFSNQLSTGLI